VCSLCYIVCSGGSTDQTIAVSTTTSTTANTMSTESDNKQQEGSTTSIGEIYSFILPHSLAMHVTVWSLMQFL